jgi:hypothetical protein
MATVANTGRDKGTILYRDSKGICSYSPLSHYPTLSLLLRCFWFGVVKGQAYNKC